jgi:oxaloacetate decarboxylase alpha subunit
MPNTPQQMLLRGQNILGYRHYADDVVDKFVERAALNGVDVFRVFDAMNDMRNIEVAMRAVKAVGRHAQGTIAYTLSPVHDIDPGSTRASASRIWARTRSPSRTWRACCAPTLATSS